MRITRLLLLVKACKIHIKPFANPLMSFHFKLRHCGQFISYGPKWLSTSAPRNLRVTHDESGVNDEIYSEYGYMRDYTGEIEQGYARDLLFKNTKDKLLNRIYNCVSVQELFNVLNNNLSEYNCEHATQTVLVLWDLKKIYHDMNNNSLKASNEFLEKLKENYNFQKLLKLIEKKINYFDVDTLSYNLLYLNKLGLEIETSLLQSLSQTLEKKLLKRFSIAAASRYLETVFNDVSIRSYLMSQNLIPLVFKAIDSCYSTQTLNDLTISLNKLHNAVTDEFLDLYKEKVGTFIENGRMGGEDYKVILQIIAFLNYPKWREKNSVLISKCILTIKNNLSALNVNELILLYEIFFKIQEPGDILSELQRCASKHYHQLDETITAQKITLFSNIIYFASPQLRPEFQKTIQKYVRECNDLDNLILLRKILSTIKISDVDLCQFYWDKMMKLLKTNENVDILKLAQNYMNFSIDIDNYRHREFEKEILRQLEKLTEDVNYRFFPQKLSNILSFVLIYGDNKALLESLVNNLETNWEQLKHFDCLKLSISLRLLSEMDMKYVKLQHAQRIDKILDRVISKETKYDRDLWKNNALLKSCIFKGNVNTPLLNDLLMNFKDFRHISSKSIENISYCFLVTNTLIPQALDNVIDYVTKYRDHILGFNVGKILYLCYHLGYHPKNLGFFEAAINTIIRDQERMTGLALIHGALALCYFNKLPNSLIKSIFNVEFMDKLDYELQNCYSKDKYPQRVRNNLMQLNRAVCLDYPECNVPWFHQKYVEEHTKNLTGVTKRTKFFPSKVREYLIRLMDNTEAVAENVVTPYGYEIDFVIGLDAQDNVAFAPSECSRKLALLLVPEFAYTRILVQLKGRYQLKKRHLEMLGYKVVMVRFSDWLGLFYAEEKIDFLRNLIWPKKTVNVNEVSSR